MKLQRAVLISFLSTLAAFAAVTGTATAATQVGQKCATATGGPPVIFARTVVSGESYVFPADGVVTKWGLSRVGSSGQSMTAAAIGTWSGTQWTIVGALPLVDFAPSVASEVAARYSVSAGQSLGTLTFNSGAMMCGSASASDSLEYSGSYVPVGTTFTPSGTIPSNRPNVWANLEADIDKDGFGDETQDQCPQSALYQSPCPVLAISQELAAAKGAILITAAASADTSLTATASVKVPKLGSKKASTVTFSSKPTAFSGGQLKKIKLKLPSRANSALATTKKSKKLKFTVTVTGNGLANTATSIKSISLPGTKK
ncbi:MAG: hypothetical protein HYX29_00315 [Solirubrobacterales bacterium]|nr:hypothetical protein [Solirubrobacterales bacterium]